MTGPAWDPYRERETILEGQETGGNYISLEKQRVIYSMIICAKNYVEKVK